MVLTSPCQMPSVSVALEKVHMQPWMFRSTRDRLAVQLKIFVTDTTSLAPACTMLMKLLTPDAICAEQVWLSSASWK